MRANSTETMQDFPFLHIKTNDDVFMEVYHLSKFVRAIFGNSGPQKKSILCDVVPSDAQPRGHTILANSTPETNKFPEYCNGLAYLMTPDLIPDFLNASKQVVI